MEEGMIGENKNGSSDWGGGGCCCFVCLKKNNCLLPPEASHGVTSVISQLILNIPLSFLDIFHIKLKGA